MFVSTQSTLTAATDQADICEPPPAMSRSFSERVKVDNQENRRAFKYGVQLPGRLPWPATQLHFHLEHGCMP